MSSETDSLIFKVWSRIRDVIQVQHKVMLIYTSVGFALFEDDELEEVGKFFYALSEEKQNGYNKLLYMMGKLWDLRFSHQLSIIEKDLELERILDLYPRNLSTLNSNYKNCDDSKRKKVLSYMQYIMCLEQRLHQQLMIFYHFAANLGEPEIFENWIHRHNRGGCEQCNKSMKGTGVERQRCMTFYSWTLELCDLLKTDFLKQEEEVLQEMQAYLDSVFRLVAQQEHAQHLPQSLQTKD